MVQHKVHDALPVISCWRIFVSCNLHDLDSRGSWTGRVPMCALAGPHLVSDLFCVGPSFCVSAIVCTYWWFSFMGPHSLPWSPSSSRGSGKQLLRGINPAEIADGSITQEAVRPGFLQGVSNAPRANYEPLFCRWLIIDNGVVIVGLQGF